MPKWRLKKMTYSKPADALKTEFYNELKANVANRIYELRPKDGGILEYTDFEHKYGQLIYCEEKEKLIDVWESRGRNTSFLGIKIGELIYQKYQILKKMSSEESLKWMYPTLDIEYLKSIK